ncbi:hypothetical protein E1H12_19125, partial [Geitlerinema sp. P-1104]|nr:hypothetical protein [Geitlerinema sp. P-1104]
TGNREQGTGNREQGTGNREQGTGNRGVPHVLSLRGLPLCPRATTRVRPYVVPSFPLFPLASPPCNKT